MEEKGRPGAEPTVVHEHIYRQHPQPEQSLVRKIVEFAPGWIQALFVVGGLVVSLAIMYNKVDNLQQITAEVPINTTKINLLTLRVDQAAKAQDKAADSNIKLAEAVNSLSVSVAKLQGELESTKGRH